MNFTKTLLRCQVIPSLTGQLFETIGGASPTVFRATGVRFAFSFFDSDGTTLLDVSNIASLTLFCKTKDSPASSPIILKTVTAFNTTLTRALYDAGNDHAQIDFTASEMAALSSGKFDLTLSGHTTDDLLDDDVFGMSILTVKDAGISNLTSPPAGTSPAVTLEQLQGILGSYAKKLGNAGDTITLVSPDGTIKRILGIGNDSSRTDDLQI